VRVAVVNLAADAAAGRKAAEELDRALAADGEADPLPPGEVMRALEEPLPRDTGAAAARVLAEADERLAAAREAQVRFDRDAAVAQLAAAERTLLALDPSAPVIARLAEASFLLGLVHMAAGEAVPAIAAFRVTRRLAPTRPALDPARYPPDVIEAYAAAGQALAKTAAVELRAPYDGASVFVDGQRVGSSGTRAAVEPGAHFVWATMAGYQPAGARVELSPEQQLPVSLALQPLPPEARARALRAELLATTPTLAAYRAAAAEIGAIAGVRAVILVASRGRGLVAAVYDTGTAQLGTWVALPAGSAARVLASLPGRALVGAGSGRGGRGPGGGPGVDTRAWYDRTWGRVAIGGTVVLTVTAGIVLFSVLDEVPPDRNIGGFDPFPTQ
jgi:hypothetical protein